MILKNRRPEIIIREAALINSTPETVYEWLRELSESEPCTEAKKSSKCWSDWLEIERSLLLRNEPLITLGLAAHGNDYEILHVLLTRRFQKRACSEVDADAPYIIAVLSNKVGERYAKAAVKNQHEGAQFERWSITEVLFTGGIIFNDKETEDLTESFVRHATGTEIRALFEGQYIGGDFLDQLFARARAFETLSYERWFLFLTRALLSPSVARTPSIFPHVWRL